MSRRAMGLTRRPQLSLCGLLCLLVAAGHLPLCLATCPSTIANVDPVTTSSKCILLETG